MRKFSSMVFNKAPFIIGVILFLGITLKVVDATTYSLGIDTFGSVVEDYELYELENDAVYVSSVDEMNSLIRKHITNKDKYMCFYFDINSNSEDFENFIDTVFDGTYSVEEEQVTTFQYYTDIRKTKGIEYLIIEADFFDTKAEEKEIQKWIHAKIDTFDDDMSTKEKIIEIHNYICQNVSYSNDDNYKTDYDAIAYGKTQCMGYSTLFAKFMKEIGVECYLASNIDHQWNVVKLNNKYYIVDCTWDDEGSFASYTYFLRGNTLDDHDCNYSMEISDVDYYDNWIIYICYIISSIFKSLYN